MLLGNLYHDICYQYRGCLEDVVEGVVFKILIDLRSTLPFYRVKGTFGSAWESIFLFSYISDKSNNAPEILAFTNFKYSYATHKTDYTPKKRSGEKTVCEALT